MDILFWRHAEAVVAAPGTRDDDRKLTAKGRTQARRVGGWLNAHLPDGCRILVSPAVRTRQTADALGRPFEIDPRLGTSTTPEAVLQAALSSGGKAVLLVGHQPVLGMVLGRVLFSDLDGAELSVRKGTGWWVRIEGTLPGKAKLLAVMGPELSS
ncbi:MAG: histidine phosphatase family protein [Rhodocyclaceae bacterium]|nr:histidine phosphatase family protein [Rhodocyclaceae bacterium]